MKKLKGFTLVELIIVIVIIGILAAVTIIGYVGQAAKARNNSAFVSLSEAVKAANVCVTQDSLSTYTAATLGNGGSICSVSTTVSGNWPKLANLGSYWKYINFPASALNPTGVATAITNAITATPLPIVSIAAADTGSAVAAVAATNPAVACTLVGCSKYNF